MANSTIPTPPQLKTPPVTPKPKAAPSWNDPDFVTAFDFCLAWEGAGYENVPGDSGGPTRCGITWIDGNAWRKEHGLAPLSLAASHACRLNYLTEGVIREIYWRKYFLPMHGADLPDPLDQVLFDCAVNTGIARSVKMLQAVLGVAQDGVFGPQSLAATQNYITIHGQGPLCFALTTRRNAFYEGLAAARPKDRQFLAGWRNRVADLVKAVKKGLGVSTACFLVLAICLIPLAGCGGGRMAPNPSGQGAPDAKGNAAPFTPNYLSSIAPARWKGSRVTYRIVQGGHSSVPGVDIEKAIRAGFNEWLPAMQHCRYPVSIEEARDGETENITIKLVPGNTLGANVLGDTEVTIDGEGYITSAPMRLVKSMTPWRLKDVAAHEMGHALGVRGHSPNRGDLMYYIVGNFRIPSQADINTIATLYNDAAPQPLYGRAAPQGVYRFSVEGDADGKGETSCAN